MNAYKISMIGAISLALSACGSSGISDVPVVGKMFGGGSEQTTAATGPEAVAQAKANTPTARAVQVAWTAMRAKKCGFNFDAQKLRNSFLQAEGAITGDPATLTKAQRAYDYTAKNITERIGPDENYCTETRARKIGADLKRHLAGDYSAPVKIKKAKVAYEKNQGPPPISSGEVFGRHWDD